MDASCRHDCRRYTARGAGKPRVQYQPRVAHNPAAQDTTPLNCSRPEVKSHPPDSVILLPSLVSTVEMSSFSK